MWTRIRMSFTSRDLRGWFHTFTSLPLVHTSNPDFWSDVFDLASSWLPKLLFMKATAHRGSWVKTPSDSWTSQIPDSRPHQIPKLRKFLISWTSPISKHPEINSKLTNKSQIWLLVSCIIWRSERREIYQDFFMNVSSSQSRIFHSGNDSRIYSRIRQI
jgi:hypothetical protein